MGKMRLEGVERVGSVWNQVGIQWKVFLKALDPYQDRPARHWEGNPQTPQEAVFLTFILTDRIPFISEALNDTAILKNNKKHFTI